LTGCRSTQVACVSTPDAPAQAGYDEDLDRILEADDEEVADMVAAVEGIAAMKKPAVKKF